MNAIMRWFEFDHLPDGLPNHVSAYVHDVAEMVEVVLCDGPEKSAGLRKLLEAKDCFVRQAILDSEEPRE